MIERFIADFYFVVFLICVAAWFSAIYIYILVSVNFTLPRIRSGFRVILKRLSRQQFRDGLQPSETFSLSRFEGGPPLMGSGRLKNARHKKYYKH